jgi:hypothetical protein
MHSYGPLGERTLQTDYEYLCRARSPNGLHVPVYVAISVGAQFITPKMAESSVNEYPILNNEFRILKCDIDFVIRNSLFEIRYS